MKKVFLLAAAAACLLACKKKNPENIPQPKADGTAVSTAAPAGLLEAPAAYVKNSAAKVDKAREAAALYERTAERTLGAAAEAGGN
ncbi:MAG: hypothetical protein NDI60_02755 [Elusimicrobiales bacterium]|nr:hypothetical protein [Elusimicrobiales bacterium]